MGLVDRAISRFMSPAAQAAREAERFQEALALVESRETPLELVERQEFASARVVLHAALHEDVSGVLPISHSRGELRTHELDKRTMATRPMEVKPAEDRKTTDLVSTTLVSGTGFELRLRTSLPHDVVTVHMQPTAIVDEDRDSDKVYKGPRTTVLWSIPAAVINDGVFPRPETELDRRKLQVLTNPDMRKAIGFLVGSMVGTADPLSPGRGILADIQPETVSHYGTPTVMPFLMEQGTSVFDANPAGPDSELSATVKQLLRAHLHSTEGIEPPEVTEEPRTLPPPAPGTASAPPAERGYIFTPLAPGPLPLTRILPGFGPASSAAVEQVSYVHVSPPGERFMRELRVAVDLFPDIDVPNPWQSLPVERTASPLSTGASVSLFAPPQPKPLESR